MSNPVFTQPRFDYEAFAERYSSVDPGTVVEVLTADTVNAGRSRQVGTIHYLQRRGLKPQVDFQTSLVDRRLFVKKLTATQMEV
jgi:hypothetical protein